MCEIEVRIVTLPPLRVASVWGFGREPENAAHEKLQAWAGPRGYLSGTGQHRIFGFNNPNPSPGSPNYGYELWVTVGPEEEPQGEARLLDFPGGLYAVTRVLEQGHPYETIPAAWKRLHGWCEERGYRFGTHQWLEEHLPTGNPPPNAWTLDLYLPIVE